jgi:hypothetical protein
VNERIIEMAKQCGDWSGQTIEMNDVGITKFAELLKQAIYDRVKEELIDDADIDATTDPLAREYLKGCNGGTVDALCHIQNFGVDIDE